MNDEIRMKMIVFVQVKSGYEVRGRRLLEGSLKRSSGQSESKRLTLEPFPWDRETQQKKGKFDPAR